MAIVNHLTYTKPQLKKFARLFRAARLARGLSQLDVAKAAFDYHISHCKVSRVERCAMPKVDAYAIGRMASVLGVPSSMLTQIDPVFKQRWEVTMAASKRGFWTHLAA